MSSAAVGTHSGAGPLSLMSCVRESSPLQDFECDNEKNVTSKKRFWNPRKWFKRKNKASEDAVIAVDVTEIGKDALRSRSTSELSVAEDEGRRRSSSSMHPGLSVSHDSVFHSPNSGSDMELDAAQSSSSLSISQPHVDLRLQTELSERLRLRRGRGDTSEDDEGLPHSPCNSPTASDGLLLDKTAIKDLQTHSTCSDGSLLSMDSYEDEDSLGPQSRHSSKVSLQEKSSTPDTHLEFGPSLTVAPLNHSAAHHRVAVKPKRTHGAPRRKKGQQLSSALPATPEVNEESSIRSLSPDTTRKETLTELYSMPASARMLTTTTETQLKCSSLPPGLTGPGGSDSNNKLNRSKSNAGSKSQDLFSPLLEEKEEKLSLFDRLFPRRSGRKKKSKEEREATHGIKEEKSREMRGRWEEETDGHKRRTDISTTTTTTTTVTTKSDVARPTATPRSGAASRQRVLPVDIPSSPVATRRESNVVVVTDATLSLSSSPPQEKSPLAVSPLQAELESRFKYKPISLSSSPSKVTEKIPPSPSPRSPKLPERQLPSTVISSSSTTSAHFATSSSITTTKYMELKPKASEDHLSKIKMPGLSSLQQRVLTLTDEDIEDAFRSLTENVSSQPKAASKPITKSHSFKTTKQQPFGEVKTATATFLTSERKEEARGAVTKAASLDSVKHLDDDEPIYFSEVKLGLKRSQAKAEEGDAFSDSSITISGPSHTAIVNVTTTSNKEDFASSETSVESGVVEGSRTVSIKEHQVSVTKIHVKRESTQSTVTTVPEFLNKQLNKVEIRPNSNIIFSMKSPRVTAEEQNRPKTLFNFDGEVVAKPPAPRKFSKDNLEIIEKIEDTAKTTTTPLTPPAIECSKFKKPEARKSSVVSIVPSESPTKHNNSIKGRFGSLDSLKSDANESDKSSSQDSLDERHRETKKSPNMENVVVLRRKSMASKKNDDEPELMKVFARRSLKLKDSDVDALQEQISESKTTRDSDKENQMDSPVEERKKLFARTAEVGVETREFPARQKKEDVVIDVGKEPLSENHAGEGVGKEPKTSPVLLRRTINNNIFLGQRAFSTNSPKSIVSEVVTVKKQSSFGERKSQWMSNVKNEDAQLKDLSPKGDFITEPKNFSQRKAEWEMRAQLAQKKTSP